MKEEILIDEQKSNSKNKNPLIQIALVSISALFLLLVVENLKRYLVFDELKFGDFTIKPHGFIVLGIILLLTYFITNKLNRYNPTMHEFTIGLITGSLVFLTELIFQVIDKFPLQSISFNIAFRGFLQVAAIFGAIGFAFSLKKVYKLRKNDTWLPNFILYLIFSIILYFHFTKKI
jgi:hypothetical protein